MTTSDPRPPEARRIEVDRGAAIELRLSRRPPAPPSARC